jgi:hypothetical protein
MLSSLLDNDKAVMEILSGLESENTAKPELGHKDFVKKAQEQSLKKMFTAMQAGEFGGAIAAFKEMLSMIDSDDGDDEME